MGTIVKILVVGVFAVWKLFEAQTNARNSWGNFLFKGKKPWPYKDGEKW
jgi:hypothetical protein